MTKEAKCDNPAYTTSFTVESKCPRPKGRCYSGPRRWSVTVGASRRASDTGSSMPRRPTHAQRTRM